MHNRHNSQSGISCEFYLSKLANDQNKARLIWLIKQRETKIHSTLRCVWVLIVGQCMCQMVIIQARGRRKHGEIINIGTSNCSTTPWLNKETHYETRLPALHMAYPFTIPTTSRAGNLLGKYEIVHKFTLFATTSTVEVYKCHLEHAATSALISLWEIAVGVVRLYFLLQRKPRNGMKKPPVSGFSKGPVSKRGPAVSKRVKFAVGTVKYDDDGVSLRGLPDAVSRLPLLLVLPYEVGEEEVEGLFAASVATAVVVPVAAAGRLEKWFRLVSRFFSARWWGPTAWRWRRLVPVMEPGESSSSLVVAIGNGVMVGHPSWWYTACSPVKTNTIQLTRWDSYSQLTVAKRRQNLHSVPRNQISQKQLAEFE